MLIGVVFGVSIITFIISHHLPGDPAMLIAGPQATESDIDNIRIQLGLDRPLHLQYLKYMTNLLQGDFGTSIVSRRPVLQEFLTYLPATIELMAAALLLAIVVGVPFGVISAVYKDGVLDHALRSLAVLGLSAPSFVIGLLLLLVFYGMLDVLPGSGRLDSTLDMPPALTGILLIDSLLAADFTIFRDALAHLVLPAVTMALGGIGAVMRVIRSSMLEVLSEDYIRTAFASGLARHKVIYHYALRNALLPFITIVGLSIAPLLFGSVVVETIFAWPGTGSYVLNSIFALDFPVIMCFTVISTIVYVLSNLLTDLIYMIVDPRIRESGA